MSIQYNPEKYGVKIVCEWEAYEPSYSFDTVLVVRSIETGKLYAATDSGCSCPVPFEDHSFPSDFVEVKAWADVKALVEREFPDDSYRSRNSWSPLRVAVTNACRAKR